MLAHVAPFTVSGVAQTPVVLQSLPVRQLLSVLINGFIFGGIFALTALGLTLIFGILDVPNFAQGEFAMFAGYLTVLLSTTVGLGLVPTIVIALVLTFVVGVAMERTVIAPLYGDDEFLLKSFFVSFGVVIAFEQILIRQFGSGFYRISAPELGTFYAFGTPVTGIQLIVAVAAILILLGLYVFTRHTYLGLAMRAVADDRAGSQVTGIDIDRVNTITFGIGALLTGVTGILYGIMFPLSPTTGVSLTAFAFVIVVVGGVGSFGGTIVASLLIGIVDNFTAVFIGSEYRFFVIFLILLLVLVIYPEGLKGDSI
ncbi:ABC transporter permease subunit [Halobellus sp. GM3]|uniref:ABC transporter permease subunit n=1 Tax=Halobellus sp. GM3 TaxID=3458410 RepID=UPI00403E1907